MWRSSALFGLAGPISRCPLAGAKPDAALPPKPLRVNPKMDMTLGTSRLPAKTEVSYVEFY
jgi:hypothetical protein